MLFKVSGFRLRMCLGFRGQGCRHGRISGLIDKSSDCGVDHLSACDIMKPMSIDLSIDLSVDLPIYLCINRSIDLSSIDPSIDLSVSHKTLEQLDV